MLGNSETNNNEVEVIEVYKGLIILKIKSV